MTIASLPTDARWQHANHAQLSAELARVRQLLERHAARSTARPTEGDAAAPDDTPRPPAAASPPRATPDSALDRVCALFGLSVFERDVLLLCAGVELDAAFASLCAAAQGNEQRPYPTFSLALAALPNAHWSALAPTSPLRRWRLVEVTERCGLTASPLRIDERVLHFIAGVAVTDERLSGVIDRVPPAPVTAPSHQAIAERVAAVWHGAGPGRLPAVQLWGDTLVEKRAIATAACAMVGLALYSVSADSVPGASGDLDALVRLWEREGALTGGALLVEFGDDASEGAAAAATRLAERVRGVVIAASRERRRLGVRPSVAFEVPKPETAEQRTAWFRALGPRGESLNGHLDGLVAQFNLSLPAIHAASTAAAVLPASAGPDEVVGALWDASRVQARARLDDLAQRITGDAAWDDLVMPDAQRQVLRDIAAHVRQQATVYHRWGFAKPGARGLGISALFAGASGTGKTMAAEVLANELRLDLYRIDLSSVVSKYIGETEKNLRRIFDAAEEAGAILLFDEADALFGKRSEVKDSHDRYANIEVSYLLQRMESYRGLAILTSNMKNALDIAFLRRIRFIVQFPFPDATQRAEIWRRVFPKQTPLDGVSAERLAQLVIAGGNIRSVALNAAFLAADAGEPVRMTHLLRAARSEYAKIEKPLTDAETAGWL